MNPAIRALSVVLALVLIPVVAHGALTVQPVTWNVVGLDSNSPATGPYRFPVGARVCSDVATANVAVNFVFDSANPYVNLRPGSVSSITLPSIAASGCSDAYFEVEITRDPAAFDTKRRYHITATDGSGTVSSPTPRELYVEHLISQNRNSINDVKYGPNVGSLTSVPAGGAMSLLVGNTYVIQLAGGTATQGYNQFESFINFPNTIFQVLSVSTSYSADNSPFVPNPNDKLYADACGWENDPNSPNYRSCVGGDYKAGGSSVLTTYTVKIIGGGGSSQSLNSLLYDFSGSSFHYNADYTVGARIAAIIDPTAATIAKSFTPNPTSVNGVSALTFTLSNANGASVSGYNFVDNLPANLVVATPPAATTSGCGTPTLTAAAGSSTISFSNGTLAANGKCVIKVNVTPTATGTLVNTTNNLFVDAVDTGHNATASLTVNNSPPPGTGVCGQTLASWTFPTGFSTTAPAPSVANVTASAAAGNGLSATTGTNSTTTGDGTLSWRSNGSVNSAGTTLVTTDNDYFELAVNTNGYTTVAISFDAQRTNNGAQGIAIYSGTSAGNPEAGTLTYSNATELGSTTWKTISKVLSFVNTSGATYIRIYAFNANNSNPGADVSIDNVNITACGSAVQPTLAKSFAPHSIALNRVSTLTFTLTNPNGAQLTGAKFTDALPSGVQVAATPAASTNCTGSPTWAPAGGSTTLAFGQTTGANIPANGSCTASVNVTATTAGPHANVSGPLSTTESGTNSASLAADTLTAVLSPAISKAFAPSPILAGGVSTLTFTITNPNSNDALSGVAFNDVLPTAPAAMTVAGIPAASTSGCGAATFAPAAGAGSVAFSGGSIAASGTCIVKVNVTAPVVGTYDNTSGNVSHVINAQTVFGNTASGSLVVSPAHPSIGLRKEVSLDPSGPWSTFLPISGGPVYYRFTVENTGDVPLSPISITDDTLNVASCNASWPPSLPVAVAANENHIATCVAGPVTTTTGSHTNTAHATGTYNGTPYDSPADTATYASTALTLDKSATETSYTSVGDSLHYTYLVTNSGFAPLAGPVTVADNRALVTCPAVSSVGDLDNYLDPGESVTCTATYTIVAGDITSASVTNTATATAQGVTSNSDSVTVVLSTAADVAMTKTLTTSAPFLAGQDVTYSLVVANAGPSTATNIQVTDTPSNLTITSVTGSGCAALPCTIASLASGANTTITVTAKILAAGAFDNSATATASQPDPNPANNTDNTGNNGTAAASADVSVVKTLVTAGPYTVGQSLTYSIVVANAGPSTATNILVTDAPSNLTITSVTGSGCAALPCTIASLAAGANTTITATATINATGAFDNSASASATEPDPSPANNTDSTGNGGSVGASADVSLNKTLVTAGPYMVGQSLTYSIVVANAGPSTATNIQVTDTPSNLTITSVTGSGCAALPCTIASLAAGANTTITATATINATGAFDNSATVSATEPDPSPANNTDNTGNGGVVGASADVSLNKTLVTAGPYTVGQSLTYSIVVANAGPSTATNIQVTDTPSNLTITSVTGSGCAALPCTIPSLAAGANTTITATATINATGAFDNSATVSATEPDPSPANNTDNTGNGGSASTATGVDLAIVKTASVSFASTGQPFDYTLVVTNSGSAAATGVTVHDTLPSNFALTSATSTQGSCSGATSVTCALGALPSGATVTITLHGTVTGAGSLHNTATVTGNEPEQNTANNASSVDPSAVGIPTLSEWALLLLAAMLAAAGALAVRRM